MTIHSNLLTAIRQPVTLDQGDRRTFGWSLGLGDQDHSFTNLSPLYTFQSESN
jgi:hypothetical protein